jgi:gliding motility-associated protein GldE
MDESEAGFLAINWIITNLTVLKPFDISMLMGIFTVVALLIFSGLISGSEIAFFSIDPNQFKELEESEDKTDALIINHLENPKRLLAIILVSNNFVNVAIVLISAWLSGEMFDFSSAPVVGFIIQVVVITGMLLLFGEIMPKIYARQKVLMFVRMMAKPISILGNIFKPLVMLLVNSTNMIDKRIQKRKNSLSMSELSEVVDIAHANSEDVETEEVKILKSITTFGETEVSEIMRARVDVAALDIKTPFAEVIEFIKEWGYSRIPVFEESFDHVKGILYIKDMLSHLNDDDFGWQSLIRDAFFIPENKKINDLLQEFKRRKIHMAIVVDEYGGTSGIVTLEDVLEEIVGEISDEFDIKEQEKDYKKLGENLYVFEAKTSINDLSKVLDLDPDFFDEVKGESDSIAGLILELTGDFPKINDVVKYKNVEFEVMMMDNRRIKKVKIKLL